MDGSKKKEGKKWKRDKAQIVHLVFCCPSPLHSLHIHSNTRLFSGRCAGNQNNKPADTLGRRRDAKQILKKDGKKKRGRCKIEIKGGKKGGETAAAMTRKFEREGEKKKTPLQHYQTDKHMYMHMRVYKAKEWQPRTLIAVNMREEQQQKKKKDKRT
ncbi:hypothetical protein, unlikely [Trypanosoma brucei gambiense DAL972]|uniref:Uncharacterized protein n=1 Tax=Trypanosoma brucei gambiense (strain MHOM/CI/86/DAL972) TaxID=679716 RepID=C9ZRQ2_TRYB9|nr:hypothetical protein, unlikely [Trypanosoma brucei gambiense DAL972]CBH12038.1 hypothetical protein, unlikely [Trypanosoma brucei gambiense DAL972]|eukprot:XP_011774321.1 hypothetical protein, unlikely [Trypanosoma brucei gambiense DAL972]